MCSTLSFELSWCREHTERRTPPLRGRHVVCHVTLFHPWFADFSSSPLQPPKPDLCVPNFLWKKRPWVIRARKVGKEFSIRQSRGFGWHTSHRVCWVTKFLASFFFLSLLFFVNKLSFIIARREELKRVENTETSFPIFSYDCEKGES